MIFTYLLYGFFVQFICETIRVMRSSDERPYDLPCPELLFKAWLLWPCYYPFLAHKSKE